LKNKQAKLLSQTDT
jgi:predicted metal-binding membrane protein